MSELFESFLSSDYVDMVADLVPMVGYGLILGFIFALLGWLFGMVLRTARGDI